MSNLNGSSLELSPRVPTVLAALCQHQLLLGNLPKPRPQIRVGWDVMFVNLFTLKVILRENVIEKKNADAADHWEIWDLRLLLIRRYLP